MANPISTAHFNSYSTLGGLQPINSVVLAEPGEPAAAAGSTDPAAPANEFGSDLSPDALMAYCQARLDSIDGQVRVLFDSQQKNQADTVLINQTIAALKQFANSEQKGPDACKQVEATLEGLIKSLKASDPNCSVLPALTATYNAAVWSGDGGAALTKSKDLTDPDFIDKGDHPFATSGPQGDNDFTATELQGYVQSLSDAAGDLNSDSELQMVHLQSLMSERQTAVSLTTNLVQSLGDQANKIADNIGH